MPRRFIWSDSITDQEITGALFGLKIALTVTPLNNEGEPADPKVKPAEYAAEWEVAENTASAVTSLVAETDLVDFMLRLRNLVSLATADSSVIREWAKKAHPEMKVPERGRIPAEITAAYRREVVKKVSQGDAGS